LTRSCHQLLVGFSWICTLCKKNSRRMEWFPRSVVWRM